MNLPYQHVAPGVEWAQTRLKTLTKLWMDAALQIIGMLGMVNCLKLHTGSVGTVVRLLQVCQVAKWPKNMTIHCECIGINKMQPVNLGAKSTDSTFTACHVAQL